MCQVHDPIACNEGKHNHSPPPTIHPFDHRESNVALGTPEPSKPLAETNGPGEINVAKVLRKLQQRPVPKSES